MRCFGPRDGRVVQLAFLPEATELGENCRFQKTDVTSDVAVKALVDFAVSEFGRLDIMHNNAGAFGARGSALEIEADAFDFTFHLYADCQR